MQIKMYHCQTCFGFFFFLTILLNYTYLMHLLDEVWLMHTPIKPSWHWRFLTIVNIQNISITLNKKPRTSITSIKRVFGLKLKKPIYCTPIDTITNITSKCENIKINTNKNSNLFFLKVIQKSQNSIYNLSGAVNK